MKRKSVSFLLAFIAMFACVLGVKAQDYQGCDAELGEEYYIYCPASNKFLSVEDANADFPENGVKLMISATEEPTTLWKIGETDEAYSLAAKFGEAEWYLNYGDNKLNTYILEFSNQTCDIDIKNLDGYYTISRHENNDGYLYIGTQVGTDKDVSDQSKFLFLKKVDVTLSVSGTAKQSTFVCPFEIELPEGITAWIVTEATVDDVGIEQIAKDGILEANTPVLLKNETDLTISRTYSDFPVGEENDNSNGFLIGVYQQSIVDKGNWVLQKQNGVVGFYQVKDETGAAIYASKAFLNGYQVRKKVEATLKVSGTAQVGTFVAPFDVILPAEVSAYMVIDCEDNMISLDKIVEEGGTLSANTPAILKSTANTDIIVHYQDYATGEPNENSNGILYGVYEDSKVGCGNYVLQMKDGVPTFLKIMQEDGIMVRANKAYIDGSAINVTEYAKMLVFDCTTSISSTNADASVSSVYSVAGSKLASIQKGINIVKMSDGTVKKVSIK